MAQLLPEGAHILPADIDRIIAAQTDLIKAKGAHGSVIVRVNLHIHYEYPKHVIVEGKSVTVKSEAEELALTAPPVLPSAEDLDRVAEEQKAVEATSSSMPQLDADSDALAEDDKPAEVPKGKVRQIKGK